MRKQTITLLILSAGLLVAGYATTSSSRAHNDFEDDQLVGAWHGKVQFRSGGFSAVKDLEFLYVFNTDGTMNESSNYDASPPVPPAYGVWRRVQPRQYEAKYVFFSMKAPKGFEEIANGGGWSPGGSGVLVETITLSEDGNTFNSTIRYQAFDQAGKLTESGSEAEAHAVRISF